MAKGPKSPGTLATAHDQAATVGILVETVPIQGHPLKAWRGPGGSPRKVVVHPPASPAGRRPWTQSLNPRSRAVDRPSEALNRRHAGAPHRVESMRMDQIYVT